MGNGNNETRKIFFHVSDLITDPTPGAVTAQDGSSTTTPTGGLKVGDEVEFVVSHGSRNGKQAAIKIKKTRSGSQSSTTGGSSSLSESSSNTTGQTTTTSTDDAAAAAAAAKRPERLNMKIKIANIDDESGKQLILSRQPVNPDAKMSTASFSRERRTRMPGSCLEQ